MSGPGAPCIGARCRGSASGPLRSSRKTVFVRSQQSVCRAPALSVAVSVGARQSSSGAVCAGAGALCRVLALFVSGPALLASGPAAPCVGARCSLSRVGVGPGGPPPRLYFPGTLSRPNDLCVAARRSLCRGPALCLSGPGALCAGARRSVCRCPALFVSGPGALSIDSGALCQGVCGARTFFLYRSSALFSALCVGARRSPAVSLCRDRRFVPRWCRRLSRCFCE